MPGYQTVPVYFIAPSISVRIAVIVKSPMQLMYYIHYLHSTKLCNVVFTTVSHELKFKYLSYVLFQLKFAYKAFQLLYHDDKVPT